MTSMILVSANDLMRLNHELDQQLLAAAVALDPTRLDASAGDGEWTPRQTLGHLAEFPHFFAREIRRYLTDRTSVIGRTHEHPDRLAAVDEHSNPRLDIEDLIGAILLAQADLVEALGRLTVADLDSLTQNVKYGEEPLRAFLDRYVIGHKAGHLKQLRGTGGSK